MPTWLITGCSTGLGRHLAQAVLARGYNAVVTARDAAKVQDLVDAYPDTTFALALDVTEDTQVTNTVQRAEERFGGVDVLVNNAGIQHVAPVEAFPAEKWDDILAINLTSSFHTIRHALPGMRARNWGRIVNIASVHGLVGSAGKSAYVAAKHGLVGLTKVTALETAGTGVTCNAICPGFVLTPLVAQQIADIAARDGISTEAAQARLLADKQPSGQFVTPRQLGGIVTMLCSPLGDEVRGAAWAADGGWTAQ